MAVSGPVTGKALPVVTDLWQRDAAALFSPEFYNGFDSGSIAGLHATVRQLFSASIDSFAGHGWIPLAQLAIVLLVGGLLRYRTRRAATIPTDWIFLARHPWSGGLFVALVMGGMLLVPPDPLWRWLQIVLGTLAATVLITAMLTRPRLRRLIMVLAALFMVTETLRTLAVPQPLLRLYLVLVCLVGTPLCLAAARRQLRRQQGRFDLLAAAFLAGTLVGLVALVSQLFGFATLSAVLIDAALGTVFIGLFARMALHLGEGAVSTLWRTGWMRQRLLIRQLGPQAERRLKGLLRLVIYAYTLIGLLVVWRLFPDGRTAWESLMGVSFRYGELTLSLETLFLIFCILYLSLIVSWFLQAILETQVLVPRGFELGVRDSIKRLTHYSLVLFGLVTALGLAGIGLEKFALLAGALGVGIGFGLQNIVNNFVSGLILLFERPVKVGDTINIDEQWGTINKIGLRSTVVETLDRAEIIVPNSELISQKVTNWTFSSNVSRIVLPVGVAYGSPLDKVLEILLHAAREHADVLADPQPSAIFTGFGDSSIDFELRVWVADIGKRLKVKSDLGQIIDRLFRQEEIVIPFPQRDLHLRGVDAGVQPLFAPAPATAGADNKDHNR
ncbi:MAG: mechanosensitive ion channel [Desulfuromonadales bacterium]|nr:mechanosensitive ion channel [Desulfuromonadales bacterium]